MASLRHGESSSSREGGLVDGIGADLIGRQSRLLFEKSVNHCEFAEYSLLEKKKGPIQLTKEQI